MPCGLLLVGGDELWIPAQSGGSRDELRSLRIELEWARHQGGLGETGHQWGGGEPRPRHQLGGGEPRLGAHALTLRVNLDLVGEPHDVNEDLNRNPADLTKKFC